MSEARVSRSDAGVRYGRVVLVLSALPFVGIGVAFLVWPRAMTALIGVAFDGATADADVRAVYGGLQLGCGAFLLWCAARRERLMPGLVAQVLAFGGLAAARFVGLAMAGAPDALGFALHGAELAGLVAGALALRAVSRPG